MSPHCGLEHAELPLTIRAVLIRGQEKNMFIFKIQHLGGKSTDKLVQCLDLRKRGDYQTLGANTAQRHQHQILLFAR